MRQIALHTRLKAGGGHGYERVHAVIPADLDAALRGRGPRLADLATGRTASG